MNHANQDTRDTKQEMCDTAQKMGQKLRVIVDNASEEMAHAGDFLSKEINAKPLKSSLVALGAGMLAGLLFARRRKD